VHLRCSRVNPHLRSLKASSADASSAGRPGLKSTRAHAFVPHSAVGQHRAKKGVFVSGLRGRRDPLLRDGEQKDIVSACIHYTLHARTPSTLCQRCRNTPQPVRQMASNLAAPFAVSSRFPSFFRQNWLFQPFKSHSIAPRRSSRLARAHMCETRQQCRE